MLALSLLAITLHLLMKTCRLQLSRGADVFCFIGLKMKHLTYQYKISVTRATDLCTPWEKSSSDVRSLSLYGLYTFTLAQTSWKREGEKREGPKISSSTYGGYFFVPKWEGCIFKSGLMATSCTKWSLQSRNVAKCSQQNIFPANVAFPTNPPKQSKQQVNWRMGYRFCCG